MKKIKTIGLILIALFVLLSVFSSNLNTNLIKTEKNIQSNEVNEVNEIDEIDEIDEFRSPKKSWFDNSMDPIFIDNEADNNWTWASDQSWCSGSGTDDEPYIIENITIDAGGSGNGILIKNSKNVYFMIKNCTVYNSGPSWEVAGINLINTNNGKIINNTCLLNSNGIRIKASNNNTISNNTANNNDLHGIRLGESHNNTVSGNTLNDNIKSGIYIAYSHNNIISGNTANNNNDYGIYLQYSHNNTISLCTVFFNNLDGIHILGPCYNNTVSRNIAYINEYHGIYLKYSFDSTISGNTANKNIFGITLSYSNNNTVSGNTVNNNEMGIGIFISINNTVSGNTLIGNTYFIYENGGSIDNIIENNICYTAILLSGISEIKLERNDVGDIDVNISIALKNTTKVLYSAFNNNTSKVSLDNGLIFLDLQLNDTNNLNQALDAPINITFIFNVNKYKAINTFWFNKSANGKQGAWEEIPLTDLGNGKIVISVNHTSFFAVIGKLKSIPLSKGDEDDDIDDINDEITILLIMIIAIIIGLIGSITASSTYYYKTRSKTRAKPTKKEMLMKKPLIKSFDEKIIKSVNLKEHIDDKRLLKRIQEENGLVEIASLGDLNKTTISPDFWEKIDLFDWNETEREDFIREMLALLPKERQEIINDMLRKKNNSNLSIRSTETIYEKINLMEYIDAKILLKILQEENGLVKITSLGDLNKTTISPDFWEKIDLFDWNETEREDFIREMLALTPKERQEILNDILKKSMMVRRK